MIWVYCFVPSLIKLLELRPHVCLALWRSGAGATHRSYSSQIGFCLCRTWFLPKLLIISLVLIYRSIFLVLSGSTGSDVFCPGPFPQQSLYVSWIGLLCGRVGNTSAWRRPGKPLLCLFLYCILQCDQSAIIFSSVGIGLVLINGVFKLKSECKEALQWTPGL